ncbi:facilitated trehalose transporter Tret1-2 homolog [Diachasmimorpha longicaudata]|uniref:facilitated trehalose transporter Tret1-2 homolog n=1 Tax=Diachasmimorpha longicaudata TaxID=58733 RepID=UPI0030B88DAF
MVWISALNGLTPTVTGIIMVVISKSPLFYLTKNNAVTIFKATGVDLDSVVEGVVLGVVQVIACCLSALLIDKIGRKVLMVHSEITMCLCLLALGGYLMMKELHPEMSKLGRVSLDWGEGNIFGNMMENGSGCLGPVPWAYMGEIFPTKLKGTAAVSAAFINWLLAFFITLSFESLVKALGNAAVLFIFSFICALSTLFVAMCVIETKGKSLLETQRDFGIFQRIP